MKHGALWILLLMLPAALVCRGVAPSSTLTQVFDPSFRSLKVCVDEDFFAPPVLRAGSDAHVVISFDQIADDVAYLRYRLLHCNADWKPSMLLESEYVDGFNLAPIDDYAFSSNTFVHFVNYRIVLPNAAMNPLVSGNYLLQVFTEDNPDRTLLQARFSVSDELADVAGDVLNVTDRGVNDRYQQLSLSVDMAGYAVQNPVTDILITVEQNNNPESLRTLPPPLRVNGRELIYEHQQQLIFDAGNEYRRFETVAIPQTGMHVDSTRFYDDRYEVFLTPDKPRVRNYLYDQTQQGRYMVRQLNASDSDLGADYVDVHFRLQIPQQHGAQVYVQGEMTDYLPRGASQMVYDIERGEYSISMPLKQGAYNYQYVIGSPGGTFSPAPIEGNHYQTRNEYTVRVYHHPPGARADKLIAVRTLRNF